MEQEKLDLLAQAVDHFKRLVRLASQTDAASLAQSLESMDGTLLAENAVLCERMIDRFQIKDDELEPVT